MRQTLFLLFLTYLAEAAELRTITTQVVARPDMDCSVYLVLPSAGPVKGLYFQRYGTGLYSMGEVSAGAKDLIEKEKVARLTLDRPGTSLDSKSPSGVKVHEEIYFKTTHSDLIQCSRRALEWALGQKELEGIPVVLSGHSEGSEVVTRAYLELLRAKTPGIDRIKALILSGVPMLDLKQNLERQLKREPPAKAKKWRAAFKKQECEVKRVQDFERTNEKGANKLNLRVHYYLAKHGLNDAAQDDSIAALLRHLRN